VGLKVLLFLFVVVIELFALSRVALKAEEQGGDSDTIVLFFLLFLLFAVLDAGAALWFLIVAWR
jgi:hypothetical protein